MAIQFASYDDNNMELGKFYLVEVNKDNLSNLREMTSITTPISNNSNAIQQLQQDVLDIDSNEEQIIDNTRRINNLEDVSLSDELLNALDQVSIKRTFTNATRIEIQHNRKEIYFKKVVSYVGVSENERIQDDITDAVNISYVDILDSQGSTVMKKVIITSTNPITGYAIII